MTNGPRTFPDGFLWGASTSAYQVEGSPLADGAGPSNWHRFCRTPGLVKGGDTGDVACDHYRLWKDDIGWMQELGLNAYRFSISWSRVLPEGTGQVNQKGLDFYRRLVDAPRRGRASSPTRRSSTGTCPRPSRTAAAGRTATSPAGSPTTRASCSARSTAGCGCGRR